MLGALQANILSRHDDVDDEVVSSLEATYGNRLQLHTLFDIPHDSDECCSADVLCLDGTPTLLFQRVGDRSDYSDGLQVLDLEKGKILLHVLTDYYADQAFELLKSSRKEVKSIDDVFATSQYLTAWSDGVFSMNSPKWSFGLKGVTADHFVWYDTPAGEIVRVREFLGWVNKAPSWDIAIPDRHHARVMTDTGEFVVDCQDLLVTLVEDFEAIEKVTTQLRKASYWQSLRMGEFAGQSGDCYAVHVGQHLQGKVIPQRYWFAFNDKQKAQAFAERCATPQQGELKPVDALLVDFYLDIDWKTSHFSIQS